MVVWVRAAGSKVVEAFVRIRLRVIGEGDRVRVEIKGSDFGGW